MKIQKNIPIPKKRAKGAGRPFKYPFNTMEVGDAFNCGDYTHELMRSVQMCKLHFRKENKEKQFTIRKVTKNRISTLWLWRTE